MSNHPGKTAGLVISGEQVRAARALLAWEQKDLAQSAGLSEQRIAQLERAQGQVKANAGDIDAIVAAFLAAGVCFLDGNYSSPGGPGVRFAKPAGASLDTNERETIQYREFFENDAPPGAGG